MFQNVRDKWNKSRTRWSSGWFTTERNDYIVNFLRYSLLLPFGHAVFGGACIRSSRLGGPHLPSVVQECRARRSSASPGADHRRILEGIQNHAAGLTLCGMTAWPAPGGPPLY